MVEESAAEVGERANLPAAESDNPYGGFDDEQPNDEPNITFEPPRELPRPELRNRRDEVAARLAELPAGDENDPHNVPAAARIAIEFDLDAAETFSVVLSHLLAREADQATLDRWRGDDAWRDDLIATAESETVRGVALAITNYRTVTITNEKGKEVEILIPLPMREVLQQIRRATDDWLRRVGTSLFVPDPVGVHFFSERRGAAALFGWLKGQRDQVKWKEGAGYVGQTEVLAELERTAVQYRGIATLPYEPPVQYLYYCETAIEPCDGQYFERLLSFFRPATPEDRTLLGCAFATPAWGGPPGKRPAFVITADEGRGVGKSVFLEIVGRLYGGACDFSVGDEINKVKTRLLTPEAAVYRIATLDNVKSMKLSWGEWEALVTAPTISGHRNYVGEGQRPNPFTWYLTLNGANLSDDIARRSVIVKLKRGKNHGEWYERITSFIGRHRSRIFGDIVALLRGEVVKLEQHNIWPVWERGVLCRFPNARAVQQVVLGRQHEANVEDDEAALLHEHFWYHGFAR